MSARTAYCDGCQREVIAEHLERRIHRIEQASRYRPLRIQILFLGEAPPPEPENYFYSEDKKTGWSQSLLQGLMEGLGIPAEDVATALREFQRRQAFCADWVECPLEGLKTDLSLLSDRYGASAIARIRNSYRPSCIIPIGGRLTRSFLPLLMNTDLASRVLLYRKEPLPVPSSGKSLCEFQLRLSEILVQNLSPVSLASGDKLTL